MQTRAAIVDARRVPSVPVYLVGHIETGECADWPGQNHLRP